jgi:hypothetical protein
MVTSERRQIAVAVLVERFGVSQRRACRLAGRHPIDPAPAESAQV